MKSKTPNFVMIIPRVFIITQITHKPVGNQNYFIKIKILAIKCHKSQFCNLIMIEIAIKEAVDLEDIDQEC
jgi:hypothetical protein